MKEAIENLKRRREENPDAPHDPAEEADMLAALQAQLGNATFCVRG